MALIVACSSTTAPLPLPLASAPPARTVRVLVTAAGSGQPVAGARVCAETVRGSESCVESARDGTASLHGPPGTYFVRVSGPAEQRWQDTSRAADLVNGDASISVELTQLRRISGRIRDDSNALVAQAEACANPASDDPPVCARSGADGSYAIDVKPGVYRLQVSGPPGGRLVTQWARGRAFLEEADVLDARAVDVPGIDVTLIRGLVLKGTVTFAGEVVENAQVCIRTLAAPLPWDCERTDKHGQYAALREPGMYYVWTVPPANIRAIPQWFDDADTGVGSSAVRLTADRTIDIDLRSGPQLSGTVRTPSGEPVGNALVCVDTAFASGRICRETDGNGHYAVTTRPETYIVSVYPPKKSGLIAEFWDGKRTWIDADQITVNRDKTLDLVVDRGFSVTGTVLDSRGVPVAGATVNFLDGRIGAAAATDTDGAGHFEVALPAGHFTMEVFPSFVGNLIEKVQAVDVQLATYVQVTLDDVAP